MPNSLLRDANRQVRAYGRIRMDTAARLMALGYDVPALEVRLLAQAEAA